MYLKRSDLQLPPIVLMPDLSILSYANSEFLYNVYVTMGVCVCRHVPFSFIPLLCRNNIPPFYLPLSPSLGFPPIMSTLNYTGFTPDHI